jgi:hypothetical protein
VPTSIPEFKCSLLFVLIALSLSLFVALLLPSSNALVNICPCVVFIPCEFICLVTKIKVANPVVEMDGDEMTRIIWAKIRNEVSTRNWALFRFDTHVWR